jgi:hypothetical protein
LRVYAHRQRDRADAMALLILNLDRKVPRSVALAAPSERYTLTAEPLDSGEVMLNGTALRLGAGDALPPLDGVAMPAGPMTLPPASITFLKL